MNVKRLLVMTIVLLGIFTAPAIAQNRTVTGKITDSKDGSPLSGANVTVAGSTIGTQTAADGTFKLNNVPAGAKKLVVSHVGFAIQEIAIGSGPVVLSLKTADITGDAVVVIGYGKARQKDLTGAIATVTEKDFQKGVITTPEQMIAGKVAGVSVIKNDGSPGGGSTIRIRGGSSLNASNDPLIVIDGVPMAPNSDANGNPTYSGVASPLSMINSDDIESFTVLKDASAAAIYGSRAANGVIIITTKQGKSGKLKVSFSSVNSVSTVAKDVSVLSGDQVRAIVKANGNAQQIAALGTANTNWQDAIYQSAFGTDNNINFSGGIKNFPYRVSLGYQNQDGILKTDNLTKTSVTISINPVLFNKTLKVDINIKGSMENTSFADKGAIGDAITFDPTVPVYSNSKRYNGFWEWVDNSGNLLPSNPGSNPLGLLYNHQNLAKPQRSIGDIKLDYKFPFLPDLHAIVNAAYDGASTKNTNYINDSAAQTYAQGGQNNFGKQTVWNTLLDFYFNYVKDFKSIKSKLDAVAGYSYNDYLTTNYNYASYNAHDSMLLGTTPTFPYDKPENVIISFFGRAAYSYADKYYLTGTVREDGSSRFGPYGVGTTIGTIGQGNKWGIFPSVAFKWRISQEGFLKNSKTISDLSVRLGYGITGQQDGIADYPYLNSYTLTSGTVSYPFGGTNVQGNKPSVFTPALTWEQTATSNIGLDYGFFNNRITGSVDLYLKKTTNLLASVNVPGGTNFGPQALENIGAMENKGVEFNVNAQLIKGREFNWNANFNIGYNKNTITSLGDTAYSYGGIGNGDNAQIYQTGYAKSTFYLYKQIYDPTTGKPIEGLFSDINRDGIINSNDLVHSKQSDPNVFLGFSSTFSYKRLSVGFVMRASFNNYVYNAVNALEGIGSKILQSGAGIGNATTNYLYTQFAATTVATSTQALSDYYLENASFLKMDNVSVGFDCGKVIRNTTNLRVSLNMQNVFTITNYTGIDPEVSNGIDNNQYPRPRIISVGLNLNL
jgi:TonB-linked SusC/RagA family outer membrane protein